MMGLGSCDSQVADLVSEAQCLDSQASVLCILSWGFLSSHSLHWDSESRDIFLTTALCFSVTCFLQSFFFFFYSCRCYKYFKTTNIEYDWRVVERCHPRTCIFDTKIIFSWFFFFFFLEIDIGETVKIEQKLPFCEGYLHWSGKFPFVKVSSSQYQKEKDVSKSQKNLVNGEYLNLCNKPSHFNFSCFSY